MIHFTCDMCGKPLLTDEDVRYVVKIEVYAAYDPMEVTEDELDEDHLNDMNELVEQMEGSETEELEDQVYKSFRFDLCPTCQQRYLRDPLFGRRHLRLDFHDN
jgi:hypothetical protein